MADQADAPANNAGFIVVKLKKAIPVFDETMSEIKMREPTAKDIVRIGNPVIIDMETGNITHNMARMRDMIAALANIPSSSVEFLAPRELMDCAWAISPFFLPTT